MKKLVLIAAAAGALALPAAPASADCTDVARVGATAVQTCQRHVWERTYITYGCAADTDLDGEADIVCEPLFEIVLGA